MGQYDHVYLSPHLDDAVFSCGGTIFRHREAGEHVLIVNVFAGMPDYENLSPFAADKHTDWGSPPDPMAVRLAEDRAVMRSLGADAQYLDYLDCIYRQHGGEFLYASERSLFGPVHPADAELPQQLVRELTALWQGQPVLYAPLSAGGHVDHELVRDAGICLQETRHQVLFYEDFPYATEPSALADAKGAFGDVRWTALAREADVERRIAAMASYESQVSDLFGDEAAMAELVRSYANSVMLGERAGERFWRVVW